MVGRENPRKRRRRRREEEKEKDGELDSVILAITLGELDADQLTVANGTTNLGTLVLKPYLDSTWGHVQAEGKLHPGHVGGHGVDQELLLKDVELGRRRTLALLAERKGIRTSGLDSHLLLLLLFGFFLKREENESGERKKWGEKRGRGRKTYENHGCDKVRLRTTVRKPFTCLVQLAGRSRGITPRLVGLISVMRMEVLVEGRQEGVGVSRGRVVLGRGEVSG